MSQVVNKRPLNPDDISKIVCYGNLEVSPDGNYLTYVRQSIKDDEYVTNIHLVELDTGRDIQLTNSGKDRSPKWSPDGQKIAFVSDRMSHSQIWIIDIHGGEAICAKTKEKVESEPVWSPDGRRIFFLSQTFAKPDDWIPYPGCPDGDKDRALEQVKRRLSPDEPHKTPPEKKPNDIKVITRLLYRRDGIGYYGDTRTHIFYMDLKENINPDEELETFRVTQGDFDYGLPCISPCGSYLVTSALCQEDADYHTKSDLWLVDLEEKQSYLLYESEGPAYQPKWSFDGEYIGFLGHNNTRGVSTKTDLYLLPVSPFIHSLKEGAAPQPLREEDAINVTKGTDLEAGAFISSDVTFGYGSSLCWDGSVLYFSAVDCGTPYVYRVDPALAQVEETTEPEVVSGSSEKAMSAFHIKQGVLALRWSNPVQPENLYVTWLTEDKEKRLTFDNDEFMSQIQVGKYDKFQYSAGDGQQIDGWVIYPAQDGQKDSPMVTLIHGGPHGVYGSAFMFKAQMFAGRGYYVSYFNPRGSISYGQEFSACIDGDWGNKDYSDIMDGVNTVVANHPIDKQNMFVHGWSYGGYMTTWIVTQTNAFKAACAGAPVSNLYTDYGCTDIIWADEHEYGGKPWENRHLYLDRSPVSHVANVETPILLLHGENDYRCRITHSEEFYQSLRRLGKTAVFVRYPNEYHGFKRPLHRIDLNNRILAWFEHYRNQV